LEEVVNIEVTRTFTEVLPVFDAVERYADALIIEEHLEDVLGILDDYKSIRKQYDELVTINPKAKDAYWNQFCHARTALENRLKGKVQTEIEVQG
jgi:hypothetical protein